MSMFNVLNINLFLAEWLLLNKRERESNLFCFTQTVLSAVTLICLIKAHALIGFPELGFWVLPNAGVMELSDRVVG